MTSDLFDLTSKVAVVTGGAGGIGVVYAEALCEAGAAVVVADVNAAAAEKTAASLGEKGYRALGVRVDVTSRESADEMVAAATEAFGGVDILINNAAIMTDLPQFGLTDMSLSHSDRGMNVSLRSTLLRTLAAVASLAERGCGRMVNGLSAAKLM